MEPKKEKYDLQKHGRSIKQQIGQIFLQIANLAKSNLKKRRSEWFPFLPPDWVQILLLSERARLELITRSLLAHSSTNTLIWWRSPVRLSGIKLKKMDVVRLLVLLYFDVWQVLVFHCFLSKQTCFSLINNLFVLIIPTAILCYFVVSVCWYM